MCDGGDCVCDGGDCVCVTEGTVCVTKGTVCVCDGEVFVCDHKKDPRHYRAMWQPQAQGVRKTYPRLWRGILLWRQLIAAKSSPQVSG